MGPPRNINCLQYPKGPTYFLGYAWWVKLWKPCYWTFSFFIVSSFALNSFAIIMKLQSCGVWLAISLQFHKCDNIDGLGLITFWSHLGLYEISDLLGHGGMPRWCTELTEKFFVFIFLILTIVYGEYVKGTHLTNCCAGVLYWLLGFKVAARSCGGIAKWPGYPRTREEMRKELESQLGRFEEEWMEIKKKDWQQDVVTWPWRRNGKGQRWLAG